MPLERLEAEITRLAGNLAAAECRWIQLIGEFDRRAGYQSWGSRTCAHWLSWHCGLDVRAARERVRVAHALEQLPRITDEFAAGKLSYSKVRALTRVASPANEADLLMIAEHATAEHVERTVRAYRGVLSADEETDAANALHAARFLHHEWADDGSLDLRVRMTPEMGALFLRALSNAREQVPGYAADGPHGENGPAGPLRDHAQTNIDALAMMAESFLANGPAARSGGDRHQVVIHTEMDVLTDDAAGVCELDDGPTLAPETARRLACDASIVLIATGTDGTVRMTSKTPAIPASTRRAVRKRDRGCRFPGCGARVFTNIHHLRHRAHGGNNDLINLLELCWHHHRLVHEGGWNLAIGRDGEVRAIRPDGSVLREPDATNLDRERSVERDNRNRGITVDAGTCIPRWFGDRLDLDHIVTGLLCVDRPESVLGALT